MSNQPTSNWAVVAFAVVVGALLVAIIVLHVSGVVGPGAH
jgi:formate/nitrite transporter FocA (FNT family)